MESKITRVRWTETENTLMEMMIRQDVPIPVMAEALNRTVRAVQGHAAQFFGMAIRDDHVVPAVKKPEPEPCPVLIELEPLRDHPADTPAGSLDDSNDVLDLLGELVEEVRGLSYAINKLHQTQKVTLALFQEIQRGNGNGKQTTLEPQVDYTPKKVEA